MSNIFLTTLLFSCALLSPAFCTDQNILEETNKSVKRKFDQTMDFSDSEEEESDEEGDRLSKKRDIPKSCV